MEALQCSLKKTKQKPKPHKNPLPFLKSTTDEKSTGKTKPTRTPWTTLQG